MAMSKRDYEALAGIFARMHTRALTHREHTLVIDLVQQVAVHYRSHSSAFNMSRFLEAAGSQSYKA